LRANTGRNEIAENSGSPRPDTEIALKTPIRFPSGDGSCAGDLHLPDGAHGPATQGATPALPVVIMAHGIGAERAFGLEPFARKFVARGLAVVTFDYRHFGESTGEPRYLVSPARQIADYLAAVDFVRTDGRVDGERIAFWGTSFSGGHVLEAAARRPPGLCAVVSQVPFVSGVASTLVYPVRYQLPATLLGVLDRVGSWVGRPPLTVAVVKEKGLALLASEDSFAGYSRLVPENTTWPGRVPARVFLSVLGYRPIASASRVPVPTLMVVAAQDAICPASAARKAARRIPECRIEELPIGHFNAYSGDWFEKISALEADFLTDALRPPSRPGTERVIP
jgi:uncharacterized protein